MALPAIDLHELSAQLGVLRAWPFGSDHTTERLAQTRLLTEIGREISHDVAANRVSDDTLQWRLIDAVAKRMGEEPGASAVLAFFGADKGSRNADWEARAGLAAPLMHPKPLAPATLLRREYWEAFVMQVAVEIGALVDDQRSHERAERSDDGLGRGWSSVDTDRLAQDLNRTPGYYPPHLTSEVLTAQLTVSDVADSDALEAITGLYASVEVNVTWPALATLAAERRAVLLGDPGSGKSTIARARVVEVLRRSPSSPAIFVSVAALVDAVGDRAPRSSSEAAEDVARAFLDTVRRDPEPADVLALAEQLLHDADAVVVLDGLDEALGARKSEVASLFVDRLEALAGSVLVTSRLAGYRRLRGWRELAVNPLRYGQFPELIEAWYPKATDPARARALIAYDTHEWIREVVGSAVLAGLVALIASDGSLASVERVGVLYERAIGLLLQRDWKAPSHPRREPGEVADLVSGYERVAWHMAVGDPEAPKVEAWSVSTTYGGLAAQLANTQGDPVALTRAELLVPYGMPTLAVPEINQPIVWLHRSFADYFVGLRLARWWRDDPNSCRAFLADAIQYPNVWGPALVIALDSHPGDGARILSDWFALVEAGDPGSIVARAVRDIATSASLDLDTRHDMAEWAVRLRLWETAFALDSPTAAARLIEALQHDVSVLREVSPHVFDIYPWMDSSLAGALVAATQKWSGRDAVPWRDKAIEFLTAYEPDLAFRLHLERVVVGERAGSYFPVTFVDQLDPLTVDEAVRLAVHSDWPTPRIRLLKVLAEIGVDLRRASGADGPVDTSEAHLVMQAELSQRDIQSELPPALHVPVDIVAAALHGDRGELCAYVFGAMGAAHLAPEVILDDWALVGDLEYALDSGRTPARPDALDMTKANVAAALNGLTPSWLSEHTRVHALLRALLACRENPTLASVDALLHAYRVLDVEPDAWPAPWSTDPASFSADGRTIGATIARALVDLPAADVLAELLSTNPADWSHSEGYIGILGGTHLRPRLDESQLLDLARWGARAWLPTLVTFPQPSDPVTCIERLVQEVPPEFLGLKANIDQIAGWLVDIGMLAEWRPKLLHLMSLQSSAQQE